MEWIRVDSTILHAPACGALKKNTAAPKDKALNREALRFHYEDSWCL